MKYIFETPDLTVLNPKAGIVTLPNEADIEYRFTNNTYVSLRISDYMFTYDDIDMLGELLTALRNQLKKD